MRDLFFLSNTIEQSRGEVRLIRNVKLLLEIIDSCEKEVELFSPEKDIIANSIQIDVSGPADFVVGEYKFQIFSRYELAQNVQAGIVPLIVDPSNLEKTEGVYVFKNGVASIVMKAIITYMSLNRRK